MATSGQFSTSAYDGYYLVFNWSIVSQSITNNSTTISWKVTGVGRYSNSYYLTQNIKVVIDGETVYNFPRSEGQLQLWNGTLVASGTYTFKHQSDGSRSFTAYAEAGIYVWEVNCTGTGTWALKDIAQPSTLTADNGTLGVEQTLIVTRDDDSLAHKLSYQCGNVSEYIAGSAEELSSLVSFNWTPPLELAAQNIAGASVSVLFVLETYSEGVHIGTTTKTITCAIPDSVKPSVLILWEDIAGVADKYGVLVQSLSRLKINLDVGQAYESPIVSCNISVNEVKYIGDMAITEPISSSGSVLITATATDQRGRSGTASISLDVMAYSPPSITLLTAHRCDADGTENAQGDYVRATFSVSVVGLNGLNTASYKLRYKASAADIYEEVSFEELANAYTVSGHAYVFVAAGDSSYNIEVVVIDNHSTATRSTSASTAFTLLNWHSSGTGMGVGKVSERERAVEFALDMYAKDDSLILGVSTLLERLFPVGTVILRYDHVEPASLYGGIWDRVNGVLCGVEADGSIGLATDLAVGPDQTLVNVSIWRRTA